MAVGRVLREAARTLIPLSALALLGLAADRWPARVDLGALRSHSLSAATRQVLDSLPEGVEGAAFFTRRSAGERRLFADMLAAYRGRSPMLDVRIVDADLEPEMAAAWDVRQVPQVILRRGDREARFGVISEQSLTEALVRLSLDRRPVVAFTTGHGEGAIDDAGRGGCLQAADALRARAYRVRSLNLALEERVPEEVDLLIVARPQREFTAPEIDVLRTWLGGGGRLLLLREPRRGAGLDGLLAGLGLRAGDGVVVEPGPAGRVSGASAFIALGADYGFHPVTEQFGLNTFWPLAGVVEPSVDPIPEIDAVVLVRSSPQAWEESEDVGAAGMPAPVLDRDRERRGPLPLAAAASSGTAGWRAVVFGSGLMAANGTLSLGGNADLLAAATDWLVGQEGLVRLPPRPARLAPLTLTQAEAHRIFWTSVVAVPLLVALLGLVLAWRRRGL